jgi:hypothetical protein
MEDRCDLISEIVQADLSGGIVVPPFPTIDPVDAAEEVALEGLKNDLRPS